MPPAGESNPLWDRLEKKRRTAHDPPGRTVRKLALVAPQLFGSVRLPQPLHHRWEPRAGASGSRAGQAAAYSGEGPLVRPVPRAAERA